MDSLWPNAEQASVTFPVFSLARGSREAYGRFHRTRQGIVVSVGGFTARDSALGPIYGRAEYAGIPAGRSKAQAASRRPGRISSRSPLFSFPAGTDPVVMARLFPASKDTIMRRSMLLIRVVASVPGFLLFGLTRRAGATRQMQASVSRDARCPRRTARLARDPRASLANREPTDQNRASLAHRSPLCAIRVICVVKGSSTQRPRQ